MSALQALGALMLALPIIAFVAFIAREEGWGAVAFIFGWTGLVMALVIGGAYLLSGGAW